MHISISRFCLHCMRIENERDHLTKSIKDSVQDGEQRSLIFGLLNICAV